MKEIAHVQSYTKSKKIMSDNMLSAHDVRNMIRKINKKEEKKMEPIKDPEFVEI